MNKQITVTRYAKGHKNPKPFNCKVCGSAFLGYDSRPGYMFCSDQCVARSRRRKLFEYRENWEPAIKVGLLSPCLECVSHRMLMPVGYFSVSVYAERVLLHRFNYEEMYGPIPHGMYILHKCDNAKCCHPEHLYVGTQAQNMRDAQNRNRTSVGEARPNSKVTDSDVIEIRRISESGMSQRQIAKLFPISQSSIGKIIARKAWKHVK